MKNNDVLRVSELGGWTRSDSSYNRSVISDKETTTSKSEYKPLLQDSTYEAKVGLKEYLESLSRYKWQAFFFAMLVFVVGLLVWLQSYKVSFSADSSLLKKNFNFRTPFIYSTSTSETWSRPIKGDVIYMRSDYVYNAARKITQCIADMTLADRVKYLKILETEAIGDTEVGPVDGTKLLQYYNAKKIDRHWFAIDWEKVIPIPFDEAIENFSDRSPKDSLIIDGKQMRTLIQNFWGSDAQSENPKTALNPNILNNQNVVLGKLEVTSDDKSGMITTTVADLNEDIAVYLSNLFPTAFIAANNRIVLTKNSRELSVIEQLSNDLKVEMAEAKKIVRDAEIKYEDELNNIPGYNNSPVGRDTKTSEVLGMIAEKSNFAAILENENVYLNSHLKKLEMRLRLILNPYLEDLDVKKRERSIRCVDLKPNSPEIQRIDEIIRNLQTQASDWDRLNASKSIEELVTPDKNAYITYLGYSEYTDTKEKIEKNKKHIEIYNTEITSLRAQLTVLADKTGLEEIDKAQIEFDILEERHREINRQMQSNGLKSTNIPEMYEWNKTATKDKIITRDTKYVLFFIGFVSILIGLIFARIADVLDSRMKTDLQVKEISPYPILAHIPVMSASERYITPDSKGTTMHRLAANLFGILGVNLRLNGQKQPDRTIAVTSSLPREGKSFVAFNLAAYYAIEGYKTCLLVADLRNPTLEPFPEIALTAKPGFLDYLDAKESSNPMPMEETILKTYIDNLHIIGPGTKKNINPTRLFDQDYFSSFLTELLDHFDTVIVDSPPLMPVVDSSLILKSVKSAIMVLNLGRVKKKDFEDTVRRLQLIDAPISGLVINRDQYAVRRKYYAYYSSGYISGI